MLIGYGNVNKISIEFDKIEGNIAKTTMDHRLECPCQRIYRETTPTNFAPGSKQTINSK